MISLSLGLLSFSRHLLSSLSPPSWSHLQYSKHHWHSEHAESASKGVGPPRLDAVSDDVDKGNTDSTKQAPNKIILKISSPMSRMETHSTSELTAAVTAAP